VEEGSKQADKSRPYIKKLIRDYFCKMKGGKSCDLPRASWPDLLVTAAGCLAGIGLASLLSVQYKLPLLFPSFGASAVLLYAACHTAMAQPRNVIGGHLLSAFTGVAVYQLLGREWWAITIGVTLAILLMNVTRTLHPPGGTTAFMAVFNGQNFSFIISPVGIGAVFLVAIAILVNNLSSQRKYPDFWF
jgi:CBS-domain-containing membrane protein